MYNCFMKINSFFERKNCLTLTASFILGAVSVLAFSPFNISPIIFITLIGFIIISKKNESFGSFHSVIFGLGFFLSGLYWLIICLSEYGQMHIFLAILFTLLLCIFLALFFYPLRLFKENQLSLFFVPVIFTLAEWIRSIIFTGFPWLSLGYSQIPNSPLIGYLPIFGIHGITFLIMLTVTILLRLFQKKNTTESLFLAICLLAIWLGGESLKNFSWVKPIDKPISVSLIQGNIEQNKKWDSRFINDSLISYSNFIESSDASLIVLPETSIPLMLHQIPKIYLNKIKSHAEKNGSNVILGVIEKKDEKFYNSAFSIGTDPIQNYRKYHLVPFGEFIPFKPLINYIYQHWLNIPFSDLSRGDKIQRPIEVGNQKLGLNICYEDVFGAEIINSLPSATILVNLSNDAWYGKSIASSQHLQISQSRAIETQRMMLRSTNTGVTAIIDKNGHIIDALPQHEPAILNGMAQGYQGSTPYIRFGNYPIISLCLAYVLFFITSKKKRHKSSV